MNVYNYIHYINNSKSKRKHKRLKFFNNIINSDYLNK